MKRKILCLFLCSVMLAGGVCGCEQDDTSGNTSDTAVSITDNVVTSVSTVSTKTTEELTSEPETEAQSKFDFIKTVESTYICGQKLSYPITWGQFGEGFTIEKETATIFSDKHVVSVYVRYNGYVVGIFIFTGCDSVDDINIDTPIASISVVSEDIDFFKTKKISVNDLSIGINHDQLFNTLGDDYREGVGYNQIIYENDLGKYRFTFNDNDSLITVGLNIRNYKNMEE